MLPAATPNRNRSADTEGSSEPLVWLLDEAHPAVRRLALQRLVGRPAEDPELLALDASLADDPWVAALLEREERAGVDGHVPVHAYKKWGGAHWRLVSLTELGVTAATPGVLPALEGAFREVAGWLLGDGHLAGVPLIDGRYRRCGSQEGNALLAASVMGIGEPSARAALASNLIRWQWPDGGWNCDKRPAARHSSFNESLPPLRGLVAFRRTAEQGVDGLEAAIEAASEFFLRHRVVESERSGEVAHPKVIELVWPPYWHYGLLPGLRALDEAGRLAEPRVAPAIKRLRALRQPDGTWHPSRRYWRTGRSGTGTELVRWGDDGERRMLTLQALEVLAHADPS